MNYKYMVAFVAILFAVTSSADTNVGGTLSANTTWTLAGSPYVATSSVTVSSSAVLTIEPGVVVKFGTGMKLNVFGTLLAEGTAASPITMTSSAASPTRGAWSCLYFENTATASQSRLSYVDVKYSGSAYAAGIYFNTSAPTVADVTVTESSGSGFLVYGSSLSLLRIRASDNTGDGVRIDNSTATPSISASTISSNGGYGINLLSQAGVTLTTTSITNNTNYAISGLPSLRLLDGSGVTASGNGAGTKNYIEVRAGTVGANNTWRKFGVLDYLVTGLVSVSTPEVLTVEPGVTLRFASTAYLRVWGKLLAEGTAASRITFTSSSATPAPGAWPCVYFEATSNASTSRLSFADILYAGGGGYGSGGVHITGSSPTLSNITISQSSTSGIYIDNGSPVMTGVTVSNNAVDGVRIANSLATPSISASTISSNGGYGINLLSQAGLTLTTTSITNNTNYAISGLPNMRLLDGSEVTASGNGAGTKNYIEVRAGTVGANNTWRKFGVLDYLVTGQVSVSTPEVLTVEPGVTLRFASAAYLRVWGKLLAEGTAASRITFTSSSATPAPGAWPCVYFEATSNASTSRLSFADILYAGAGGYGAGGVIIAGSSPTLSNITISQSSKSGISIDTGSPVMSGLTVSNNAVDGVRITNPLSAPSISASTISSNGGYGINVLTQAGLTLTTTSITNNTNYAISGVPNMRLLDGSGVTASGNGAGTKNYIELRIGSVGSDTTWSRFASLDYVVSGQVSVSTANVLTVDPGVTLRFVATGILRVYGKLLAEGTAASRITLTSSSSSPARGAWQSLYFMNTVNSGLSRISFADISYAGAGYSAGIYMDGSSPAISNVTVTETGGDGVVMFSSSPSLNRLSVTNNSGYAIRLSGTSVPVIRNSSFSGNGIGGIINTGSLTADARLNHWNALNGPSGTGTGPGQSVSTKVLFDPWLTTAPSAPQAFTETTVRNRTSNPSIGVNTSVDFSSALSGNWSAKIFDAANILLRTISGSGATGSASWDGKNDSGADQPSGNYWYQLETATAQSEIAAPARGVAKVDLAKQLVILSLAISEPFFSPNADTIKETAALTAATEWEDTAWTVNVKTAGGSISRTASGSGMAISYAWDGKNAQGTVEPDGLYTLEVVTSVGTASASASGTTTLDTTLPSVSLTAPLSSDVLSNVNSNGSFSFPARGSVSDANGISNWTLYTRGSGAIWTWLASGAGNVSDAVLGTWATETLPSRIYEVRLQATDPAGNLTTVINTPFVGHFKVTQPAFQLNAATGETITYTSAVPFELTETIVVKNSAGQVIRSLFNGTRAAGSFTDVWNGRNDAGIVVPDGPYTYIATAATPTHSFTWDLSAQMRDTNPEGVASTASTPVDFYNNQPVKLTYTLNEPSRIMIGASLVDHAFNYWNVHCSPKPANTTCMLQDFKPAGTHVYTWAGTDENGISVTGHDYLIVVKRNQLFSKNMVLVFGNRPAITNPRFSPVYYGMGTGPQTLSFDLAGGSGPMAITIHYLNQSTRSLINTVQLSNQTPGAIDVVWNGLAGNGSPASPGHHTVFITATDSLGNSITQSAVMTIAY